MMMQSASKLKQQEINWLDLPTDVTTNILTRIGYVDILQNVQKVCPNWCKICEDPAMWRVIDMITSDLSFAEIYFEDAVDRSQGQLVDLTLYCLFNAELFFYAAQRSSQLRRLEIVSGRYYDDSLTTDALMKFPLLEELNLYGVRISKQEIETVGRYCPLLKTLKVNPCSTSFRETYVEKVMCSNTVAIAIGQNLVGLRHLELIRNKMTNKGLQVILDNCHHLETLDLRRCINIDLDGDLGKKCSTQIKHLKLPKDSLEGCHYYYETETDNESSDEDDNYNENKEPWFGYGPGFSEFDLYCAMYDGY